MFPLFLAAFSIGLVSSLHCIGMCGPIALALPLKAGSAWSRAGRTFLYNAGRIATYGTLGMLFGILGVTIATFGYQQKLSIFLGMLIILFVAIPNKVLPLNGIRFIFTFFEAIRKALGKLFTRKRNSSLFLIGVLNGLLPCGMVYMASAGAIATGDILKSFLFMVVFGLGTLPAMWSISFFGNCVSMRSRKSIRSIYPYIMIVMGCFLILRGLGLGIDYLSPLADTHKNGVIRCVKIPDAVLADSTRK